MLRLKFGDINKDTWMHVIYLHRKRDNEECKQEIARVKYDHEHSRVSVETQTEEIKEPETDSTETTDQSTQADF